MTPEFTGKATAITPTGFATVANDLGVKAPELWTVFAVETSGCGFLPDRRPPILYERHIFSRLSGGQFDNGDISSPTPRRLRSSGCRQYDRLARAIALDRSAALQSPSRGLAKIMGMNFALAGFGVEDMVSAMCDSEDSQMLAFAAFLRSSKLDAPSGPRLDYVSLRVQRSQLRPESLRYKPARRIPEIFDWYATDITTRAAQLYLTLRGFHPGPVDGVVGPITRDALQQFQQANGLPVTGRADDGTLDALTPT